MFKHVIPWNWLPSRRSKSNSTDLTREKALSLRSDIDRFFDEFFEGFGITPFNRMDTFTPAINLSETDKEYIVTAELPGIEKDNVNIELTDGVLTISGKKEQRSEKKDENYHRIECSYGAFSRSIPLPGEIVEDKITAKYNNGVLEITLPKTEEAKKRRRKIEVTS